MAADATLLIASVYHDDPNAREFADVLARHLPESAWDLDYPWDAPIPPRDQWEAEASKLADHIERTHGVTLGEYAARRAEAGVVVFYSGVGNPAGHETVMGHPGFDFVDDRELDNLPGEVDEDGNWLWTGDERRTDYHGNSITYVSAFVDGVRWQEIVDEYNAEVS